MKSCLIFCCVILAVIAAAQGADDGCKINDKTFIKVGETYSVPGACKQIECVRKNEHFAKTCVSESAPPNCKYTPQDNSKSYPECCPSFDC